MIRTVSDRSFSTWIKSRIQPSNGSPGDLINREILSVIRSYCGAQSVRRLLADQKKSAAVESRLVGENMRRGHRAEQVTGRLDLDHLVTMCRMRLTDYEYQEVLLEIGHVFKSHGELTRAEELYSGVIRLASQNAHGGFFAEASLHRGEVLGRQARWLEANSDLGESKRFFQKEKDYRSLARVENILGTNLAEQGLLREASSCFRKALRESERTRQKRLEASISMNLGIIQNIIGNWDEAVNYFRRALPVVEGLGELRGIAEIHHNMGMSHVSKGELKSALRSFGTGLEYANKVQDPSLMSLLSLGLASVHFKQRDFSLSLAFTNRALANAEVPRDRLTIADAYKFRGMIFREMEEYSTSEMSLRSSIRINEELGNMLNLGESYAELARLERARRHPRDAENCYHKALEYFKKVGARAEVKLVGEELHNIRK